MKNIHILPTDKPSRLYLSLDNELDLDDYECQNTLIHKNQNIYITNSEEIKVGDYVLLYVENYKRDKYEQGLEPKKQFNTTDYTNDKIVKVIEKYDNGVNTSDGKYWLSVCKKVILTTDPELIKDGVQPIDDEFLEWFVKNPSCDFIETEKWLDDDAKIIYSRIIPKEEPKQETLEEAAIQHHKKQYMMSLDESIKPYVIADFIAGAKWQAEKMYSEEHMIEYAKYTSKYNVITPRQWFEQFKNLRYKLIPRDDC